MRMFLPFINHPDFLGRNARLVGEGVKLFESHNLVGYDETVQSCCMGSFTPGTQEVRSHLYKAVL